MAIALARRLVAESGYKGEPVVFLSASDQAALVPIATSKSILPAPARSAAPGVKAATAEGQGRRSGRCVAAGALNSAFSSVQRARRLV